MAKVTVGVSSCLLGQPVRYDGGHKRDDFVVDTLGRRARLVAVCPEVELGLGTPRETLRLVRTPGDLRLVMANGRDYTDEMRAFAARRVRQLEREDLDGYIFKRNSPSCGTDGVPVHGDGTIAQTGRGLFAAAVMDRLPDLPVEDEGRLAAPAVRDRFLERVFAYRRVKDLFRPRWTMGRVVEFHTANASILRAHDERAYRSLSRLVARGRSMERAAFRKRYIRGFMAGMV